MILARILFVSLLIFTQPIAALGAGTLADAGQPTQKAFQVADIVLPKETFIDGNLASFDVTFDTLNAKDPASSRLLSDNPGLREAMLTAGHAEMTKILEADFPGLRTEFARAIAKHLQPADYDQVIAFLNTAAARKARAASFGVAVSKKAADIVANKQGDASLTSEDGASINASSGREILKTITPEDVRAISAFTVSPAGRRYSLAKAGCDAAALAWANSLSSKSAPIAEATTLAAQKFLLGSK